MKQQNTTRKGSELPSTDGQPSVKVDQTAPEEPASYEEAIEAILFAAGHPVSYETLAKALDLRAPIIRTMVRGYAEQYNHSKVPRGVILLVMDEECQLCTKADYLTYIRIALGIRRSGTLSASNLETLAVIAYHQPVTRSYIDAVRGVDSSYAVSILIERGLIESKGRLDAPGRPTLFGTSAGFLRCFGLNSIEELPDIENNEIKALFQKVEDNMEAEAEAEALANADPHQITIDTVSFEDPEDVVPGGTQDNIVPPTVSFGTSPINKTDDQPDETDGTDDSHFTDDHMRESVPEIVPKNR